RSPGGNFPGQRPTSGRPRLRITAAQNINHQQTKKVMKISRLFQSCNSNEAHGRRHRPVAHFPGSSKIRLRFATAVAAALLALATASLQAGYDNGAPNLFGGATADVAMGTEHASDFRLGADNTITSVHWWGLYNQAGSVPDNFSI